MFKTEDFKNHKQLCRLCLKEAKCKSLITDDLRYMFQQFTCLELFSSNNYSNFICEVCSSLFKEFSAYQIELADRQARLYKFVNKDAVNVAEKSIVVKIKKESNDLGPKTDSSRISNSINNVITLRSNKEYVRVEHNKLTNMAKNRSLTSEITRKNCQNEFSFRDHMRRHNKKESRDRFECQICDKTISTKRNLERHFYDLHVEDRTGSHPCSECGKVFVARSLLETHVYRQHINKRNYSCLKCPKVYTSKANRNRHMSLIH